MTRVVLDTNVFVSSLLTRTGSPSRLLDLWRGGRYLLVTCPGIVDEIRANLESPRIQAKYAVSPEDIGQLVALLHQDAMMVPGLSNVGGTIPEDPKDEMILACALDAEADLIVSGDHHLLDLGQFRGIPVVTIREFLTRVGE